MAPNGNGIINNKSGERINVERWENNEMTYLQRDIVGDDKMYMTSSRMYRILCLKKWREIS